MRTAAAPSFALSAVLQLRTIAFFADLTADELLPIAEITTTTTCAAGDVIVTEGQEGDHMYIISAGSVEVLRGADRIALLGVGDCFGEMALLDRTPRAATIRALNDTRLVTIARDDFHDLLELYPSVSRAIAKVLVARLREANR